MGNEAADEILRIKEKLGSKLAIAAHHYQRPEIVAIADFVGDSYKLAVEAAARDAEWILFCGVRFMAESAAILARDGQAVVIPDPAAGCPMADMIDAHAAEAALAAIDAATGASAAPVTYMNSYADMKALTGRRGGSICTSSNAAAVLARYIGLGRPVFFSPDYNLGINTANALGISRDKIFTIKRDGAIVGSGDPSLGALFIWDGSCHVHKRFTGADVASARARDPRAVVMVHPECDEAVVAAADLSGSTEAIFKAVMGGAPGSSWVIGTEASFVHRLADTMPDRSVVPLRESYCFNMARIDLAATLASLRSIESHADGGTGPILHRIGVDRESRDDAARALGEMIAIVRRGA